MFGIKTKKDKRIEELEKKLECMYYKHPTIIERTSKTRSIGAKVILEDGMPAEYAKEKIARMMVGEVKDCVHYDVVNGENGKAVLTGYLNVVE